jgi:hypothetical protein
MTAEPTSSPFKRLLRNLANELRSFSPYEWVFACTVLLVCTQFIFLPRDTFFSPDEGMRIIASRSLRADSLFTGLIRYQGQWLDTQMQFVPYYPAWFKVWPGPHLQLNYSHILYGTLLAPFVAAGGVSGAQVLSILASALMGVCTAGVLQRVAGRGIATLGVICVMLTLPSALYAFLVWEHILTLALVLLALWCFLAWQHARRLPLLILSACCLLITCALRIEATFVIAPILLWALVERAIQPRAHRIRLLLAAGLALLAMTALYGWLAINTPQRLPALTQTYNAQWLQRAGNAVRYFVAGYGASDATLLSLLLVSIVGGLALWRWRTHPTFVSALAATMMLLGGIVDMLSLLNVPPFSISNPGLLGSAPILLAVLMPSSDASTPLRFLKRGVLTTVVGYVIGALLFTALANRAASVMSQTGSTWANRYFLLLYPLAGLAALQNIHTWLRSQPRAWAKTLLFFAIGVTFTVGVLSNLMGLSRIAEDKRLISAVCRPIWQSDVPLIVTDDWWRAEECAANAQQTYLLVTTAQQLPALNQTLWNKNTSTFLFISRDGILPLQVLRDALSTCYAEKIMDNINDQPGTAFVRIVLKKRQTSCP